MDLDVGRTWTSLGVYKGLGCRNRIHGDGVHRWTWEILPERIPRNMAIEVELWNVSVEMTRGMWQ